MQVDLDLGNYERFLDITLTRDNNVTTGKVYQVKSLSAAQPCYRHGRCWPCWCGVRFHVRSEAARSRLCSSLCAHRP